MNLLIIYQYKDILVFILAMTKILNDINNLLKLLLSKTSKPMYNSIFTILKHTKNQLENIYYIYILKPQLQNQLYNEQINLLIIYLCIIYQSNYYYNNQKLIEFYN
jgi:hypothetical protein